LEQNRDKINKVRLFRNKNSKVIDLIKNLYINDIKTYNLDLLSNPLIFELDYKTMKKNNEAMEEELIKEIMKPSRVFKMIVDYGEEYMDLMYED